MFTKINDIEKLPKVVAKGTDCYALSMYVTALNTLCLMYDIQTLKGSKILCGVVAKGKRTEIAETTDCVGSATTLEEAVNMLYEYIQGNKDIEVYPIGACC